MKILDEHNRVITDPDLERGYLVDDRIFIQHHEETQAVEEIGHYETIAEYPNGGKDVEWVIDVAGVDAVEAWDEYEEVQRYVLYSRQETIFRRIDELKYLLSSTDYCVIKIAEGAAVAEDYSEVLVNRQNWRAEINELERELEGLMNE